jgi:hypothetical protein
MHRSFARRLLASAAIFMAVTAAEAGELPLTRVVLSSAGLAQFTRMGAVSPGFSADLTVRLDQVDDVLKSLTIYDEAAGIGTVSLPGQLPLAEVFRALPFDAEALESRVGLLRAMIGSEIEITGPVAAKGRLLKVEDEEVALPNGAGQLVRHRLTLMKGQASAVMVQAMLEDVAELRFSDPQVGAQIERALAAVDANRVRDSRRLSIGFVGSGSRTAGLAYVVAAPVWKTSYRLVLPRDGGKARLQGWAVIENLTGGDWNNVELTLVAGNPVALRQPLYTPMYSVRPEVPVTAGVRLTPKVDDAEDASGEARKLGALEQLNFSADAPRPAPPPAAKLARAAAPAGAAMAVRAAAAEPMPDVGTAALAAEAEEASTQVLYTFPAKVSLATGQTMLVPFVDRALEAKRVWLYQPETSARHPLAAVKVANDGDSGLPAGLVTAFEGGAGGASDFVGDAQLPLLSKGASRFVTFALDTRTDIRRKDEGTTSTQVGTAVNGVLTVTTHWRHALSYELTAPADEDRDIVIEENRALLGGTGWSLARDTAGVETTPTQYRTTVKVPRGKTTSAALAFERTDTSTATLTALAPDDIVARVRNLQNQSEAFKATLARLSALATDLSRAKAQLGRLDAEHKGIVDDQARIRENLKATGQDTDLGKRFLELLKEREDRLAQNARQYADTQADIVAKQKAAEDVARQLSL